MSEYNALIYELLDEGTIAKVTLNRPETRNAQNRELLDELGRALLAAEADDQVRVVILAGAGPLFSSGHDLAEDWFPTADSDPALLRNGGSRIGAEQQMLQEWHLFFQSTWRWRNLRKITIAQVQGGVYSAGLMLMWACDLIVAADNTKFADVVGSRLGMCGVEYFAHPWEFGARKTKELMLTGDSIDADEAHRLGMVSKVFPLERLAEDTLEFARRIAKLPTITALLIKESVNQTLDNQGFYNALHACFTLHELNHTHWRLVTPNGTSAGTVEFGLPDWTNFPPVLPAIKDAPAAPPPSRR